MEIKQNIENDSLYRFLTPISTMRNTYIVLPKEIILSNLDISKFTDL